MIYILPPMPHPLEHCCDLPLLCLDIPFIGFVVFFYSIPPLFGFRKCCPSHKHTHSCKQSFLTLILILFLPQPPPEYCWECVRISINIRDPNRSGCVSAPGTSTGVNSFAASPSATRHSTIGYWMLQRRRGILSSRVCLCLFI